MLKRTPSTEAAHGYANNVDSLGLQAELLPEGIQQLNRPRDRFICARWAYARSAIPGRIASWRTVKAAPVRGFLGFTRDLRSNDEAGIAFLCTARYESAENSSVPALKLTQVVIASSTVPVQKTMTG